MRRKNLITLAFDDGSFMDSVIRISNLIEDAWSKVDEINLSSLDGWLKKEVVEELVRRGVPTQSLVLKTTRKVKGE